MSAAVILSEKEMLLIRNALKVYVHQTNPPADERDVIANLPEVLRTEPYDPYQRVEDNLPIPLIPRVEAEEDNDPS